LVLAAIVMPVSRSDAASPEQRYPQMFQVANTFNNTPFDYQIRSAVKHPGYVMYRMTYPSPVTTASPQNNTVPAEYYVPDGVASSSVKRPAVICIHILDGNTELTRMTCVMLASRGIPAIMFKLPYYGERSPNGGPRVMASNPQMFIDAVAQALQEVRRTVDLLASRPEVNAEHIGITGISLGGIVSSTAAGFEPRISRVMPVLAGGDLWTIIHHARETRELSVMLKRLPDERQAEIRKLIQSVDPLENAAKLRERAAQHKVYMVNAGDDEVIPRVCTEKLAAAIGVSDRVRWLKGLGHYTAMAALPELLEEMVVFFGEDLPDELRQSAPRSAEIAPIQTILKTAQQLIGFLLTEPVDGKCHFADLAISVSYGPKDQYDGRLAMIRGAQKQFRLEAAIPKVGEVMFGQGHYPWMVSPKKVVFKGDRNAPQPAADPLRFVLPEHMTRIRMVAGAIAAAAITPGSLDSILSIKDQPSTDGKKTFEVTLKSKARLVANFTYKADGKTPERIVFDAPGVKGAIEFRQWQVNTLAHDAMFAPPTGLAEKSVDALDLHRVFSSLINFAVENLL
jgi:dienelactone hydrolase